MSVTIGCRPSRSETIASSNVIFLFVKFVNLESLGRSHGQHVPPRREVEGRYRIVESEDGRLDLLPLPDIHEMQFAPMAEAVPTAEPHRQGAPIRRHGEGEG